MRTAVAACRELHQLCDHRWRDPVTVTGVGDINGDGYSDFILSDPGVNGAPGAAHLFFGSATPQTDDLRGSSPGRRIDLVSPDGGSGAFGVSVSGAGDIDGDGYADFLVADPGAVHVYFGAATPTPTSWNGATSERGIDLSNPNPMLGLFGITVAGGGDIDGDGHADFLVTESVGGVFGNGMSGVWLLLGTATPSAAVWTGASATRRIDLTQIAALWVVAAVDHVRQVIAGALGRYGAWEALARSTS